MILVKIDSSGCKLKPRGLSYDSRFAVDLNPNWLKKCAALSCDPRFKVKLASARGRCFVTNRNKVRESVSKIKSASGASPCLRSMLSGVKATRKISGVSVISARKGVVRFGRKSPLTASIIEIELKRISSGTGI